jgi:hypothetical protein
MIKHGTLKSVGLVPLIILMFSMPLHGQVLNYQYFYRVYLNDKGSVAGDYKASDLLSERAIMRRQKAGIPVPDQRDLPVNRGFLKTISALGPVLHSTSKWMNTAVFKTQTPFNTGLITALPFVREVRLVKRPGIKSKFTDKLDFKLIETDQSPYDRPLKMVHGDNLHSSGYTGKNILIAVLDGGFTNADNIESLENLRNRNGIKNTYDFINRTDFVYNANNHGTAVLSILAGDLQGYIAGTAPGADFILLKTEDVTSEFPCEEDFWAAGAEYADSCGADVISSSLGYFNFDDPSMDYRQTDLDGNTAFVTNAADIAASKGILVVNSAGNERDNPWQKIIFPSDGDSVLAAAAVDENNVITSFSSAGPSADGRVKPDNAAMGQNIPVQTNRGQIARSAGTSFSCPVLSGMCACLLQAIPEAANQDILDAVHRAGDRFSHPDSLYGYGIPDMTLAAKVLREKHIPETAEDIFAFPNPASGEFEIIFRQPPGSVILEIFSVSGKLISKQNFPDLTGRTIIVKELINREQGIYFIRLTYDGGTGVIKIVKVR